MKENPFYNPYWLNEDELEHYGVKGMKWGVRKDKDRVKFSRKSRITKDTKKSKYRLKLEEQFRKQGMSAKEAEEAAAKKIKTQKIIAGVAGVSLASVAAYVAYNKYADEFIDKTLSAGTKFQTIDRDTNIFSGNVLARNIKDRQGRYYASYDKRDRAIYKGLLGKMYESDLWTTKIVSIESSNTKDFKIPSRSKASSIFKNLYDNDSDFRSAVQSAAYGLQNKSNGTLKQKFLAKRGLHSLLYTEKGKTSAVGYDLFNSLLQSHGEGFEENVASKFYTKLKENGYNALIDMNDKRYSGFKAKNPLIIFDMDNVVQNKVQEISSKEIDKAFAQQDLIRNGIQYLAAIGVSSGGIAATEALKSKKTKGG